MAFLSLLSTTAMGIPAGPWETVLLNWFGFVFNYGWRIVVFTLILKLVLSPLDIYQRLAMRKNQKITERIKPEMDKLQQQFGADKAVLSQKQMALNKKEGFSYMSSCLPMIVTIAIFFWLLFGMNNISQYMSMKQYVGMYDQFVETQTEYFVDKGLDANGKIDNSEGSKAHTLTYEIIKDGEKIQEVLVKLQGEDITRYQNEVETASIALSQESVRKLYYGEIEGKEKLKVDFLWIKNIWSPDVPWKSPIPEKPQFLTNASKYATDPAKFGGGIDKPTLDSIVEQYDKVTLKLRTNNAENKANGYLVLPLLSIGLSILSQLINSRQQKKSGQQVQQGAGAMKFMMILMPLMMGFFALSYTSVFTLYIIINSLMTILINLGTSGVITLMNLSDKRTKVVSKSSGVNGGVVRYGRPDPNELKITREAKKNEDAHSIKTNEKINKQVEKANLSDKNSFKKEKDKTNKTDNKKN